MRHHAALRHILDRLQRREEQVDVAIGLIDALFMDTDVELDRNETPEDAIGAAVTAPPVGTLTSYAGMETKQTRSDEELPLSESQREEEALLRQLEEEADVELEDEMEMEDAIMEVDEPEEQS